MTKPDCTGEKFGYLTVLGKSDRTLHDSTNIQLWKLRCDCGSVTEKPRSAFDNNKKHSPSCGCQKRKRTIERNQKRAKPSCIGQKFGRLLVLEKSGSHPKHGHLWKLCCDCGNEIELPRGYFDRRTGRGQVSCGCKRKLGLVDNKRRPHNITGQKFGALTAIALTGKKDASNKPTWLFQCDCGKTCERSKSDIGRYLHSKRRINCGVSQNHPERWLHYPPIPNPCPKETGDLLVKYLHLTNLHYKQVDQAVEDEKRDRLLRAAWVITYRRAQGEEISELRESRIIKKYLRYCSLTVFWRRKLEQNGGLIYDSSGKRKDIGITMTKLTSKDYPVLETQGIKSIPTKKLKFYRR